jgi:hypothetical protein
MKLFWILKQKNYPVEEIYQSLNTKTNKPSNQNSIEEFSDAEYLNTDPPKSKNKPSNVPTLKMNQVEPNSFSDESAEESF